VTSVIDLWRAVDPEARLLSGSPERLRAVVRGVARSRSAPPHLPPAADGQLLVMEHRLAPGPTLDELVALLAEAILRPVAVVLTGVPSGAWHPDTAGDVLPILGTSRRQDWLSDAAESYLQDPDRHLRQIASELRLAAAEAALADPAPGTPAGLVAGHLRRGVAISVDRNLVTLHSRPAGRALAARFAALHGRLLDSSPGRTSSRRTREGIYVLERPIRAGASVWLFDDLPFARVDEVGADALTIVMRALLARPSDERRSRNRAGQPHARPAASEAAAPDGALRETLLAVARANGRVAPAARALGVHRNTVLYRLRRASAELGLDPRRPEDALRILGEAPRTRT
jgi:PucR C-terminal helix-turn-helix domain